MRPQRDQTGELAPLLVFALLSLVAVVVAAGIVVTKGGGEGAAPSGTPPEEDHQLTNAEAIARFKELDALRRKAYRELDEGLLPRLFTSDSPTLRRVIKELRLLKEDQVRSLSRFETLSLSVRSLSSQTVELRQVVLLTPKFVSAAGRDVTGHAPTERQVIAWTLQWERGQLLIHDSVLVDSKPVDV